MESQSYTGPKNPVQPAARVLVVDDEPVILDGLATILEGMGHEVTKAHDGAMALEAMEHAELDLVLTDLRMPKVDGLQVLRAAQRIGTPVVVLTASTSIADCVEAMRAGALDFVVKPAAAEGLRAVVCAALDAVAAHDRNRPLSAPDQPQAALIGESAALQECLAAVRQVAPTEATVLLLGESGTGKEVFARLIHSFSPRAAGPLVSVDCSILSDSTADADLLGDVTPLDGNERRTGYFARVKTGTIVLDNVAALGKRAQGLLMAALRERRYKPLGSSRTSELDARVLATSNVDLAELVRAGSFRSDLYFQLNVVPVTLPPLRDRWEDIPLMIEHFLALACRRAQKKVKLSEAASVALALHDWPGNVRELQNLVERLVILSTGDVIGVADLPTTVRRLTAGMDPVPDTVAVTSEEPIDLVRTLTRVEAMLIGRAMRVAKGNKTRAAEALGIKRTTLVGKLKLMGGD